MLYSANYEHRNKVLQKILIPLCFFICAAVISLHLPASTALASSVKVNPEQQHPAPTTPGQVQVYDITQQKLVLRVPNSVPIQQQAAAWLKSIQGVAPQINIPKCGSLIRVPLAQPYQISLTALHFTIQDVFLIYCPREKPLLLVFSPEHKPYLFTFSAPVKPFLEMLHQ
ncbi:type IV secretion system protein VirB6 [Paenibacillus sediminis]|uniref:Uncharacterized protein n=1 Tax=Paenibacillus sediminis TaxID=664909 RepID=A0ABS4GZX2_9BACL|nr:type IV secretion system protein VirB6 [Paenibacillus sediminis]MBP1935825.1 hypothetical protein [Paenibacillus sediminis]